MDVQFTTIHRETICRTVLTALPEWFGIEEALEGYVQHAASAPMVTANRGDQVVGYASLAEHFDLNCELHSMGVLPSWHGRGVGRLLLEAVSAWAQQKGYRYLTVKTLAETHPDPNYAATRQFYGQVGFKPFEILPGLWSPDLPCLVMIKDLGE